MDPTWGKVKGNSSTWDMGYAIQAFMEYHPDLEPEFRKNSVLEGACFLLGEGSPWKIPPEGIYYLDIDHVGYASPKSSPSEKKPLRMGPKDMHPEVLAPKGIRAAGCGVGFLPDIRVFQYFKMLGEKFQVKAGVEMLHERGDNLYDEWAWVYDPAEEPDCEERFLAIYEENAGYDRWEIWGHPFLIRSSPRNPGMENIHYPSTFLRQALNFGFPPPTEVKYTGNGFPNREKEILEPFLIY